MTLFSYRAINEDSKEVQGSIEAENLDAASSALVDLHLEPIEINEAMRLRKPAPAPTDQPLLKTAYAFEGSGKDGAVRKGTIQAATKRQAFDRIRHDQNLTLTMLTPLGVPPAQPDPDLAVWQSSSPAAPKAAPQQSAPAWNAVKDVPAKPAPAPSPPILKTVSFNGGVAQFASKQETAPERGEYYPLIATMRLYAGWLLAWYALFIAVGYYASVRDLGVDIPVVQGFYSSSLVISFMLAIFLFLFSSTLHRILRGGLFAGIASAAAGIGGFVGLRMMLS